MTIGPFMVGDTVSIILNNDEDEMCHYLVGESTIGIVEGYGRMYAPEGTTGCNVQCRTSTGYMAVRSAATGEIEVYGAGFGPEADFNMQGLGGGEFFFWSSDADGAFSGDVLRVRCIDDGGTTSLLDVTMLPELLGFFVQERPTITTVLLGDKPNMEILAVSYSSCTSLDLSGCTIVKTVSIDNNTSLTSITPPPNQTLWTCYLNENALNAASVDDMFNKCDPAASPGNIQTQGGTNAAPTSASDAARAMMDASNAPLMVSGAGTADANGEYSYTMHINGKPMYDALSGLASLFWEPTPAFGAPARWTLGTSSGSYKGEEDVPEPKDVVLWDLLGAANPPPTVTGPTVGWTYSHN